VGGIKHYGLIDDDDVDDFEKYLEEGGECAYVFMEFSSNPILVSVDLIRLRKLVSFSFLFLFLCLFLERFAMGTGDGKKEGNTNWLEERY
jgi:hypothetical protein